MLDKFKEKIFDDLFVCALAKITKLHSQRKINAKPLYKIDGIEVSTIPGVPLMSMGNSNSSIEVELKKGDIVVLIFLDYDSDNVIISGENKEVNTKRKHQMSDAIAFPFNFTPFNKSDNKDNQITIKANGDVVLKTNSTIKLGENASEGLALGDSLKNYLDSHKHDYSWTHDGGSGTTSSPTVSSPNTSNKVVTE
ncbi:MAG: hypothetical protein K9L56_13270 [Clostridiales bacterium]|nr:hypothetical protein [Clostridiales bacterium]